MKQGGKKVYIFFNFSSKKWVRGETKRCTEI